MQVTGDPLLSGLVGYWSADGGNRAFDLTVNRNDGILHGDAHCEAGKYGWAWQFDGDGDFITIDSTKLNYSQGFSIGLAFTGSTAEYDRILARGVTYRPLDLRWRSTNRLELLVCDSLSNAYTIAPDNEVTPTTWVDMFITVSPSTVRLYFDGVEVGNTDIVGGLKNQTGYDWVVGCRQVTSTPTYGSYWEGKVSHGLFAARILTASEVWRRHGRPFAWGDRPDPLRILAA